MAGADGLEGFKVHDLKIVPLGALRYKSKSLTKLGAVYGGSSPGSSQTRGTLIGFEEPLTAKLI